MIIKYIRSFGLTHALYDLERQRRNLHLNYIILLSCFNKKVSFDTADP